MNQSVKTCIFIFTDVMKTLQVLANLILLSLLCPILFGKCSVTLEGYSCIQAQNKIKTKQQREDNNMETARDGAEGDAQGDAVPVQACAVATAAHADRLSAGGQA